MRIMLALSLFLIIPALAHAATPAQTCQSNKNKTAGKYDYCRQKVEAKYALTADSAARKHRSSAVSTSTLRSGRCSSPRPLRPAAHA